MEVTESHRVFLSLFKLPPSLAFQKLSSVPNSVSSVTPCEYKTCLSV